MDERLLYTFPDVQDAGSDIERVQRKFAADNANQERVPEGVVMSWHLTVYEVANVPGSVPLLSAMMNMDFERYMTALLSDAPEFLAAVLAFFKEVEENK